MAIKIYVFSQCSHGEESSRQPSLNWWPSAFGRANTTIACCFENQSEEGVRSRGYDLVERPCPMTLWASQGRSGLTCAVQWASFWLDRDNRCCRYSFTRQRFCRCCQKWNRTHRCGLEIIKKWKDVLLKLTKKLMISVEIICGLYSRSDYFTYEDDIYFSNDNLKFSYAYAEKTFIITYYVVYHPNLYITSCGTDTTSNSSFFNVCLNDMLQLGIVCGFHWTLNHYIHTPPSGID